MAAKLAVLDPVGTVTDAGTETVLLLLDRATLNPPAGAAAVSDTVHVSVAAPVMLELWHDSVLRAACALLEAAPLPCNLTLAASLVEVPVITLISAVESAVDDGL